MGKKNDDREPLAGWSLRFARSKVNPAPGVRAEWAKKGENHDPACRHKYQTRGTAIGREGDNSWYCVECGKPM